MRYIVVLLVLVACSEPMPRADVIVAPELEEPAKEDEGVGGIEGEDIEQPGEYDGSGETLESPVDGFYNAEYTVTEDTFYPNGLVDTDSVGDSDYFSIEVLELGSPDIIRIIGLFETHEYSRLTSTGSICDEWYVEVYGTTSRNRYSVCGAIAGGRLWLEATFALEQSWEVSEANAVTWQEEGRYDYEISGWRR